jgi:hypothetical protein
MNQGGMMRARIARHRQEVEGWKDVGVEVWAWGVLLSFSRLAGFSRSRGGRDAEGPRTEFQGPLKKSPKT